MTEKILVTGAGGFIGHHLVSYLKNQGHWVRGVDIKRPQFEKTEADEFYVEDLRHFEKASRAVNGVDQVYNLAADMGGIGYITGKFASLARNNVLINSHMLEAARMEDVDGYLYTSSACVYPEHLQDDPDADPLTEEDAIPADPEKGYGWEKLYSEQLTQYYNEDYGLDTRTVRFHNIYGPLGAYEGGKEKAPAALCRKVAEAEDGGSVVVWGDGKQTRTFCHVKDCVEGLVRLMESGYEKPINLGTTELVTIDELVDIICDVAGKDLEKDHDLSKPQGVRGRDNDVSKFEKVTGWTPEISLQEGIEDTYEWIWRQLDEEGRAGPPKP
jgi:nucleoside-diphosphate-sugar epimerase